MSKFRVCLLFAAAQAGLVGCSDPGFEQFEEITKLRTLAIQVDPPELGPGEIARIESLTVEPSGAPIELAWELCLFTEGPDSYYACAQDDDLGVAGVPLGSTEVVELPYEAIASVVDIRAICDALAEIDVPAFVELPDCERGLDLTLRLTATSEGQTHITTFPLLVLFDDADATAQRNRIPQIGGLLAGDVLLSPESPTPLEIPADGRLRLQALVNATEAEEFTETDDAGVENEQREQLAIRWFATHGRYRNGVTYFAEDIAPATELQFNALNLQRGLAAEPGDEIALWIVVRDTRGGVSWGRWDVQVIGFAEESP